MLSLYRQWAGRLSFIIPLALFLKIDFFSKTLILIYKLRIVFKPLIGMNGD